MDCGKIDKILTFDHKFKNDSKATRVKLTVTLSFAEQSVENHWYLWVYPMNTFQDKGVNVIWKDVDFDLRWTLNRDYPFARYGDVPA